MISRSTKIFIAIVLFIAIAVIVSVVFVSHINSQQKVTVSFSSDISKMEIYHAEVIRNSLTIDGDKVATIKSGEQYTLNKGLYALKPYGNKIKTDLISLQVGDKPINKSVDIDYSSNYLSDLTGNEEAALDTAIQKSNPELAKLYTINPGNLYHHGEWYGTTLSYIGTETLKRDTLRLVLKKDNGEWKVVTNPPQIVLSAKNYPSIPFSVLKAVNDIDLGLPLMPGMSPDPVVQRPGA